MRQPIVGIIMGSDSDLSVMQEAAKVLEEFNIAYEITIVSAHRTTNRLYKYAQSALKRKLKIIIAGAGGAAHLPGMTASLTILPVIGVPIKTKNLEGLDSLLSVAQMPSGIPVATVAVNGAKNAGLLAIEILALNNKSLQKKLFNYKKNLKAVVIKKSKELERLGFKKYLTKKLA